MRLMRRSGLILSLSTTCTQHASVLLASAKWNSRSTIEIT